MGETRVAMEPSYNGSSPDALTCDWEYDVWLFWPSTSSLQSLPRVDDEGRFERKALEAWKSQNSGTNQQSERVDPLHCTGHHTIDAHDVHAASRDMGAMGYSRIFRSGLVAKVEPPSAIYPKL